MLYAHFPVVCQCCMLTRLFVTQDTVLHADMAVICETQNSVICSFHLLSVGSNLSLNTPTPFCHFLKPCSLEQ